MNVPQILRTLSTADQALVRPGVPLRELTTLGIGGKAALVCPVRNPEQARRFHSLARENDVPVFVLGGGSNILAADRGYSGIILCAASRRLDCRGEVVHVGAGLPFDDLIARTLDLGLTGLEFASGIPGTVGGAVVGNAGCYGHEIGEFLVEATILTPDGRVETVGPEAFGFRYRATDLRESGHLVLEVGLRLTRGDVAAAAADRAERIADRRRKHPVDLPSAGSWFRNLPPARPGERRRAAGKLLEEAGALSFREGDAQVFPRHANMIINRGRASSSDVLALAARMKQAVRQKFGLALQEEVRYLGDATA